MSPKGLPPVSSRLRTVVGDVSPAICQVPSRNSRWIGKIQFPIFLLLFALIASPAFAAIQTDASTSVNQNTASSTITSPAFSTKSGQQLLLAMVATDSVSKPNAVVQSVTGAGLVWTLVVRTNAQSGTSEIWRAFAPTALSKVQVVAHLSQTVASSLTVTSFTGVNTSGTGGSGAIGAISSGHASSGAPAASLITTQANSLIVGVGNDYDNAVSRTPLAGQAVFHQSLSPTGDTYWMQVVTSETIAKGTKITLGDSAPSADQYNLSACEILAATAVSPPQVTLSATSLAFGSVTDGSSKALTLTLTSSGGSSVSISSLAVTGTGFSIAATALPKTLAPGQTLAIPVTFKPTTAGNFTGKLTVVSNSTTGATSTVSLTGTGVTSTPKLTLSATALSYGSVTDGTSKALSLTLTSSGTASLTVSSISVTGTGFSIAAAALPKTLTPGQTLAISITFKPTTAGNLTGRLTIVSNSATGTTSTVSLAGTGVASTPKLTLSATALSYGSVTDGTSKALSITLTSSGTASLTISSISVTGTGFSIAATALPKTLTPGQTLAIPVTFKPTTASNLTGKLTVVSNSSTGTTSTVSLAGTGVASTTSKMTLSATSLSYGSVTDGTSKALSLTLTSSGTGSLTISSATVSGTGFAITANGTPITLAAGQSLTMQITFSPKTAGAVTGSLSINSNSSTTPTPIISLSGTGVQANPILTVSSTSLNFGTVDVNSTANQTVTLSSTGTSAVTINSASVTGTGYSLVGRTFPISLSPGSTTVLTVQFTPTVGGASSGKLTITSNSVSSSTSSVALSGTGQADTSHSVDLTWVAPSSSPTPVAGYHIYRALSPSTTYSLLTSSLDTQTSYVDSNVVSGSTYNYEVRSVDNSGTESAPSNLFTITIP